MIRFLIIPLVLLAACGTPFPDIPFLETENYSLMVAGDNPELELKPTEELFDAVVDWAKQYPEAFEDYDFHSIADNLMVEYSFEVVRCNDGNIVGGVFNPPNHIKVKHYTGSPRHVAHELVHWMLYHGGKVTYKHVDETDYLYDDIETIGRQHIRRDGWFDDVYGG